MTENVNPTEQNGNNSETPEQNTAPESTENASVEATSQEQTAPQETAAETPAVEAAATGDQASADAAPEAPAAENTSEAAPAAESEAAPASQSAETPAAGAGSEAAAPADAAPSTGEAESADAAAEPEPEPEPKISLEEMRRVWDELTAKKDSREAIDVVVTGVNRGGVVTEYEGVEIFVPLSHWSIDRSVEMPDAEAGQTFPVFILEISHFDTDARRVTGTRRSILRKELIDSLEVGQRLQGRISSITDFGAFVDIGGVDGLLHVSEMSYARNKQPNELVKKGQEIEVIIKSIEKGGKRISLGHKELYDSPWAGAATKFAPDSIQKGKIVSLTDLGAFVELEPGVDGLIRPRELSWTQRIGSASEVLNVGQEIEVMVLNVNEDQERMSLSLKRAQENPWPQLVERFSGDGVWEAEVKELSNKGAVVSVDGVEGFLPRGRMGRDARKLTEMQAGDKLQVRVVEIDPKRPSVIFGTPMEAGGGHGGGNERGGGGGRRGGGRDRGPSGPIAPPQNELKNATNVSNFSLGDMLGDALKEKLGLDSAQEETPAAPAPAETPAEAPAAEAKATDNVEAPSAPAEEASAAPAAEAPEASADAEPQKSEESAAASGDESTEENKDESQG